MSSIRLMTFLGKIFGYNLNDIFDSVKINLRLISFKAGLELRKLSLKCKSLEDYYNLINSFKYTFYKNSKFVVGIKFYQKKEEIIEFIKFYWKKNPKIILEIGTYEGGTLFFLSKFANPNANIITIDLPLIRKGLGYSPAKIPFLKSFRSRKQKFYIIRKNSQKISTVEKVKRILKGRKIDVLFIDGDHSYEGVKKDFENYCPFVREDGIIAFHDIVEHPKKSKCKVSEFWNEIKAKYECKEFISEKQEKWAGIGLIINKN